MSSGTDVRFPPPHRDRFLRRRAAARAAYLRQFPGVDIDAIHRNR